MKDSKYESELSLEEIRKIQLNILNVIHCFCTEKQLRYSLAGGTLLGAVRHNGYIPWDDDIDLMMPRPDYEVFINEFVGFRNDLVLQDAHTDPSHYLPFAKVYDKRTELISANSIGGVYVDIFPIDGLPDASFIEEHYRDYIDLTDKLWYSTKHNYKYISGGIKNKIIIKIKTILKSFIYPSRKRVNEKWDVLFNKYPFDQSEFAGVFAGGYGLKEHMPKCVFDHYIDLLFEGKSYKCIKEYDIYLSKLYGDYMTLPPVEERISHHHQVVYWKESL